MNMVTRNIIEWVAFALLTSVLFLAMNSTVQANDDFAINEFREMKMQPSLERALRHKEILEA